MCKFVVVVRVLWLCVNVCEAVHVCVLWLCVYVRELVYCVCDRVFACQPTSRVSQPVNQPANISKCVCLFGRKCVCLSLCLCLSVCPNVCLIVSLFLFCLSARLPSGQSCG